MSDCKSYFTPVDTQANVFSDMGIPISDPTTYRSLAVTLQYLTFIRHDIAYMV
jgi:hypothetical protein